MTRVRTLRGAAVAAALLVGAAGCGKKEPAVNEKATAANAARVRADMTSLVEAEAILGPAEPYQEPGLAAGLKAVRWGPGPAGEEIRAVHESYGKIVSVTVVTRRATE